jgi:hypothetical protein
VDVSWKEDIGAKKFRFGGYKGWDWGVNFSKNNMTGYRVRGRSCGGGDCEDVLLEPLLVSTTPSMMTD